MHAFGLFVGSEPAPKMARHLPSYEYLGRTLPPSSIDKISIPTNQSSTIKDSIGPLGGKGGGGGWRLE